MSDQADDNNLMGMSELDMLKQRATMMGIQFSNNIKIDTLRERIEAKLAGEEQKQDEQAEDAPLEDAMTGEPIKMMSLMDYCQSEALKLVRVRIACMDPKKKDLQGEIFTIANEYIGTVRKFVPFDIEVGWHIPHCLYEMIRDRTFLNITTKKNGRQGQELVNHSWIKEFSIEVLEPLTEKELQDLATAQAASGSVG